MNLSLTKRPSAYLPVAMSLVALALVLGYVAVYGYKTSGQPQDEGAAAHLFQLLMVLQPPRCGFCAGPAGRLRRPPLPSRRPGARGKSTRQPCCFRRRQAA